MSFVLAAAEEGGFNPFAPEFGLPIYVTVAFLIVLYFLAKRVFPILEETMADRERRIKLDLEQAEETRAEAEKILEEYKARVNQAREESNQIVEQARQDADRVRRELVERAESEAREIVARAQEQLQSERDRAVSDLQRQLGQWSSDIAGRIIGRELNPDSHRDLVESFIKEVGPPESS